MSTQTYYCFEDEVFSYFATQPNPEGVCIIKINYEDMNLYENNTLVVSPSCIKNISEWKGLALIL